MRGLGGEENSQDGLFFYSLILDSWAVSAVMLFAAV
jgi:hypothetical protein